MAPKSLGTANTSASSSAGGPASACSGGCAFATPARGGAGGAAGTAIGRTVVDAAMICLDPSKVGSGGLIAGIVIGTAAGGAIGCRYSGSCRGV